MIDHPLEVVRLINITMAFAAFNLNLIKGWRYRLVRTLPLDAALGYCALMAWCLAYVAAGIVAMFSELPAGIWTIIMILPVGWTLAVGLIGWDRKN